MTPSAAQEPRADAGAREFPFTTKDFYRIAAILRAETGIALTETKAPLVYARLIKRVRALGLQSFETYCALIAADAGAEERGHMTSALTTNVTRFFREPHHFKHLASEVLPELVSEARRGGRVRLWSAGCSSGEEPYSIAMTLLNLLPDAHRYDIKILATDIDTQMLQRGRAGRYSQVSVGQVEPASRNRWLAEQAAADGERVWAVAPALRELVSFRTLNLIGDWPMRGKFQAIFCRNTVIYFEEDIQRRVWSSMAKASAPGGFLYIGHSERMAGTDRFSPVGLTIYQRAADNESEVSRPHLPSPPLAGARRPGAD
jgi:chemotaxis protein methyltransferase CheR